MGKIKHKPFPNETYLQWLEQTHRSALPCCTFDTYRSLNEEQEVENVAVRCLCGGACACAKVP